MEEKRLRENSLKLDPINWQSIKRLSNKVFINIGFLFLFYSLKATLYLSVQLLSTEC